MKNALLSLSMIGLLGLTSAAAAADLPGPGPAVVPVVPVVVAGPLAIVQFGPTTPYSTINCAEFVKEPNGTWRAIGSERFGLGFVQGIVPPVRAIKVGSFIYNNIDLYSQLEEQCVGRGVVVRARY